MMVICCWAARLNSASTRFQSLKSLMFTAVLVPMPGTASSICSGARKILSGVPKLWRRFRTPMLPSPATYFRANQYLRFSDCCEMFKVCRFCLPEFASSRNNGLSHRIINGASVAGMLSGGKKPLHDISHLSELSRYFAKTKNQG